MTPLRRRNGSHGARASSISSPKTRTGCKKVLGPTDRRKIDEYLNSVREVEKRLDTAADLDAAPSIPKPHGIPAAYSDHARLMFDLTAIAFQTDMTRVSTFMMGREGSNLTYPEIEVNRAHHGMTHHRGDPEKIEDITRIQPPPRRAIRLLYRQTVVDRGKAAAACSTT